MAWANILNPLNHFNTETYAKIPGTDSVIINRFLRIFSITMLSFVSENTLKCWKSQDNDSMHMKIEASTSILSYKMSK